MLCIFMVFIYCKLLSIEEVILKSNEGYVLIVLKVFEKDKVCDWFVYKKLKDFFKMYYCV